MSALICVLALLAGGQLIEAAKANADNAKVIDFIQKKNFEGLTQFLSKATGLDTNQPDSKGRLAIVEAAKISDVTFVDGLIQFGAQVKAKEMSTQTTPLHIAFQKNACDVAKVLLEFGADPAATDKTGRQARELASKECEDLLAAWDVDGAMAFEEMPGSWTRVEPKEKGGAGYWYNTRTSGSRWNTPPPCAWHRTEVGGLPAKYINTVTGQETTSIPKALSWRKIRVSNEEMWFNWQANITVLAQPQEMPESLLADAEAMMNARWYNKKTGEYSWEDPAHRTPWRAVTDDEGKTFYYNIITAETTWELPVEMAWNEQTSDQHDGMTYFFNQKTGESTWEMPEHLNWSKDVSDM
jgi:hypothetical protein